MKRKNDADFGNNPLYDVLMQFNSMQLDTWALELRLSSTKTDGIRWVGGVFLDMEERDQGPYGMQFPGYDPETGASLGSFETDTESQTDSKTNAVFGQLILPLGSQFDLTLGARYQRWQWPDLASREPLVWGYGIDSDGNRLRQ